MTKLLRALLLSFCLLAVTCPAGAANNWAGSNACAVFSLDDDSGIVRTDDVGSNVLTDYNTVGQDTSDYKEGNGCVDLDQGSSELLYIPDGDLDAGFPGKSGGAHQSLSCCFWMQVEVSPSTAIYGLVTKLEDVEYSWGVYQLEDDNKLQFIIGYNGGASSTILPFGTALSTGIWYHVAVTYDSGDRGMKMRVWDDNASQLLDSNATDTAGGDMSPDVAWFQVGTALESPSLSFDGQIDEVVVFAGEALSDADIDKVRAGTYGAAAGGDIPLFMYHYMNH